MTESDVAHEDRGISLPSACTLIPHMFLGWVAILLLAPCSGCGETDHSHVEDNAKQDSELSQSDTGIRQPPANYHFLKSNHLDTEQVSEFMANLPFDVIQLERTGCYGPCPSYVITLRRDGVATFVGREHPPRTGKFTGTISPFDFGKLCWAIEKFGLMKVSPSLYESGTLDHSTTTLRVKNRSTLQTKEWIEDGLPGPIELWVVQNSIDKTANDIRWSPQTSSLLNEGLSTQMADELIQLTVQTTRESTLPEQIRLVIDEPRLLRRFAGHLRQLEVQPLEASLAGSPRSRIDVEFILLDFTGHEWSLGLTWDDPLGDRVVENQKAAQILSGVEPLRQFVVDQSGLPRFGGMTPLGLDPSETEKSP